MARTKVQEANEAVLAAGEAWLDSVDQYGSISCLDGAVKSRADLIVALRNRREAIAAQDVEDAEAYLRNEPSTPEREALQRAMLKRRGHRRLIWKILWHYGRPNGMSDRALEAWVYGRRGDQQFNCDIPVDGIPHQTISSARKSLVDAGLVYKAGYETVGNSKHTLWLPRYFPEGTS